MRKPEIQKKPPYPLASVDNALLLLQLLRDTGSLRLKEAAAELDVAPSTAHRLLAMLVYRGFAIQDVNRNYMSGAAMGEGPAGLNRTRHLRLLVQPHLALLSGRTGETANLMIRVGTKARFLLTVEGTQPLRVGDRKGAVLPAHLSSGGKALLAELDPQSLVRLFRSEPNMANESLTEVDYAELLTELEQVRQRGFALNHEGTEDGVSAVGVAIHDGPHKGVAAISIAAPTSRLDKVIEGGMVSALQKTAAKIERDLKSGPLEQ